MKKKIVALLLIIGAFIQIFPFLWLITFSFKSNSEIFGDNVLGLPQKWLWANYQRVFSSSNIIRFLANSFLITAIAIIGAGILASMAAFAITRLKWKFSNAVYILFLLGMMIPLHAVLLPLFITLRPVLNTYLALIIPYIGFAMPLSILILCGSFKGIPRELEEAAYVDGASVYRVFLAVLLPLTKPVLATVSILTYLSSWNELMFAITFINKEEFKTLTFGIMSMTGRYVTNWGPIGAGLVVATIPTLIIYILMSEQIQASLAAGAVKG
ncbi:sugar ABC transporter permease [Spirochaetia bacterium]|nr:sugar ABC transporter permease [Spirochaetia bacterium]